MPVLSIEKVSNVSHTSILKDRKMRKFTTGVKIVFKQNISAIKPSSAFKSTIQTVTIVYTETYDVANTTMETKISK